MKQINRVWVLWNYIKKEGIGYNHCKKEARRRTGLNPTNIARRFQQKKKTATKI